MKKFFAIVLAGCMVFGITGCGGTSDTSATTAATTAEATTAAQGGGALNSKTAAFFADKFGEKETYLKFKTNMDILGDGEEKEVTITLAVKDEMMFCGMQETEGISADVLLKDSMMYTISHEDKAIMKMELEEGEDEDIFQGMEVIPEDYEELADYTTGSEEINGKTYEYEEFAEEFEGDVTMRYYFEGDDLKYIKEVQGDEVSLMEILEASGEAPAGIFELPADYTVMDLAELMKGMNLDETEE